MPQITHRNWRPPFLAQGPVYVDSSIVVAHLTSADRFHAQALQFIGDHALGQVSLMTSLLTLDETIWRMMKGMASQAYGIPLKQLRLGTLVKKGPHVVAPFLPRIKAAIDHVTTWAPLADPMCSSQELWSAWFDRLSDVGGLHDACHLALTEKMKARSFVTADRDYRQVSRLPFALAIYYV